MIAPAAGAPPPTRPAGPDRSLSPDGLDGAETVPATPAAQGSIDARIAALVARASTPEDEALERQREEFDLVTRVQAETDREMNALRDLAMEQIKHDDELLKKWIELS